MVALATFFNFFLFMSQPLMKSRYLRQLGLFTAAVAAIIFLLKHIFQLSFLHAFIWYILLFIFLQTLISAWMIQKGARKSQQSMVKNALAATAVRLTLSILIIFIALQAGVANRVSFVLSFLIMYFTFLIFELISLLTTLRANFEKRL